MLHPLKSELNWPLGDRHALDFAPVRWELPWYLLSAVLRVQEEASGVTADVATFGAPTEGGGEPRADSNACRGLTQRALARHRWLGAPS